jgi:hypothetical protein
MVPAVVVIGLKPIRENMRAPVTSNPHNEKPEVVITPRGLRKKRPVFTKRAVSEGFIFLIYRNLSTTFTEHDWLDDWNPKRYC